MSVIPKTWEEFCNRTPIRQEYFIGYDSKINLRENKGRTPRGDRNLHASEVEAEAVSYVKDNIDCPFDKISDIQSMQILRSTPDMYTLKNIHYTEILTM